MTRTGTLLGTLGYMAPEQLRTDPIDRRADVYALGAILFELLALTALHEGSRVTQIVTSTLKGADARPSVRAPPTRPLRAPPRAPRARRP